MSRVRRALAFASVALLLSGCGSARKGTPIAERQAPEQLRQMLVGAAAVSELAGAPRRRFVQQKVDQAGLEVDRDPRAPCGAKLTGAPSLQRGALAVFVSGKVVVTQWVDRLAPGRARALVEAEAADAQEGCDVYLSTAASGARQLNRLARVIPLPRSLADRRLATVVEVGPVRGKPVWGAQVDLQRGRCLMRMILFSPTAPRTTFVRSLATLAGARLDDARPSDCA